jgi:hypothetical protein
MVAYQPYHLRWRRITALAICTWLAVLSVENTEAAIAAEPHVFAHDSLHGVSLQVEKTPADSVRLNPIDTADILLEVGAGKSAGLPGLRERLNLKLSSLKERLHSGLEESSEDYKLDVLNEEMRKQHNVLRDMRDRHAKQLHRKEESQSLLRSLSSSYDQDLGESDNLSQTVNDPVMFGPKATFKVKGNSAPQLAEAMTNSGPVDPEEAEIASLQDAVNALKQQVKHAKMNIAKESAFEEQEAALESQLTSEKEMTALQKEALVEKRKLEDEKRSEDGKLEAQEALAKSTSEKERENVQRLNDSVAAAADAARAEKKKLALKREAAAHKEAEAKAALAKLQAKADEAAAELATLDRDNPAHAAQIRQLEAEQEAHKGKLAEAKMKMEREREVALVAEEERKKKELELNKALAEDAKLKAQLHQEKLEADSATAKLAGAQEAADGVNKAGLEASSLSKQLGSERSRLAKMESDAAAQQSAFRTKSAKLQNILRGEEDDGKLLQLKIESVQKDAAQQVALLAEAATRKARSEAQQAKLEAEQIEAEIAAASKKHTARLEVLKAKTQKLTAEAEKTQQAEKTEVAALNAKEAEEEKAGVKAAGAIPGKDDANSQVDSEFEAVQKHVQATKVQESEARANMEKKIREMSEASAAKIEAMQKASTMKIEQIEEAAKKQIAEKFKLRGMEEASMELDTEKANTAGNDAEKKEAAVIDAAKAGEARAVDASVEEAIKFAQEKAQQAEKASKEVLGQLDEQIQHAGEEQQQERVSFEEQKARLDAVKAETTQEASKAKALKMELQAAADELRKTHTEAGRHAAASSRMERANLEKKQEIEKHAAAKALLEAQLTQFDSDMAKDEKSIDKQDTLHKALSKQVNLLEQQSAVTSRAHHVYSENYDIAESNTVKARVENEAMQAAKTAALDLVKQKRAALHAKIETDRTATAAAKAEVAVHEKAAKEAAGLTTPSELVLSSETEDTLTNAYIQDDEGENQNSSGRLERLARGYDVLQMCAKQCINERTTRSSCMADCTEMNKLAVSSHIAIKTLMDASQALIETAAGTKLPEPKDVDDSPAGLADDNLSACANQCFYADISARPECMRTCMSALGEEKLTTDTSNPANKEEVGNGTSLGESQNQESDQDKIETIIRHCRYYVNREAVEAVQEKQRRDASAFMDALTSSSQQETSTLNLIQEVASGDKGHKKREKQMWFSDKYDKNGKRDKNVYDNTSMLCSCVRGCDDKAGCVKNCVWEREATNDLSHTTRSGL